MALTRLLVAEVKACGAGDYCEIDWGTPRWGPERTGDFTDRCPSPRPGHGPTLSQSRVPEGQ